MLSTAWPLPYVPFPSLALSVTFYLRSQKSTGGSGERCKLPDCGPGAGVHTAASDEDIIRRYNDHVMRLILAGQDTLESRSTQLTERFFRRSVLRKASSLQLRYLLPERRKDISVTGRLRHARTFELPPARTKKSKFFRLANVQCYIDIIYRTDCTNPAIGCQPVIRNLKNQKIIYVCPY